MLVAGTILRKEIGMRSDERSSGPRIGIRSRAGLVVTGVALALALTGGPVSATHTDGTLDWTMTGLIAP